MRLLYGAGLIAALCISGCHAADKHAVTKPLTTSTSVDAGATVAHFRHEIWPAMVAYSTHPGQASSATATLDKVIDPGLSAGGRTALHDAVLDLNIAQVADATHNQIGTEDVQLGSARIAIETANDASLNVCYTYTALSYGTSSEPEKRPGASEMTIGLHQGYLHSINDDHVVPNCPANND